MPERMVQPTRPGWRFWLLWMLATVVGAAVGLLLSLPLNELLVAALGGDSKPPPWTATETALIILFKGAEGGMIGIGMGLGQWWVFRKYLKETGWWVLATGVALFLQGAFRWNLPYDTSAWQVGVDTMLSFGVLLGIAQWFVLRGRVPYAGWWIAISVAAWVLALALTVVTSDTAINSFLGVTLFAIILLLPFAVAGAAMVWLLRQSVPARVA
jgi:hypothetical protein